MSDTENIPDHNKEDKKTSRRRSVSDSLPISVNDAHVTPIKASEVSQPVSEDVSAAEGVPESPDSLVNTDAKGGDRTSPSTTKPARGYSWETFTTGNTAAQKSGARSPRIVEPIAKKIAKKLRAIPELDYLSTSRFAGPLMDYARAEASLRLYKAWIDNMSIEEQATTLRTNPPIEIERRMGSRVDTLADRLGLFPRVSPEVAVEIAAARKTLARRAEGKQLQADLRTALRQQIYGVKDPE